MNRLSAILLIGLTLGLTGAETAPVRAVQYESSRFNHPDDLKIRSSAQGNWYVLGEEVVFSAATGIPEDERIRVTMTDVSGSQYLTRTIPAAEFNRNGWHWKSDEPGYYEVRFERIRNSGADTVTEHWTIPIWRMKPDNSGYEEVARESFARTVHAVVVSREKTRAPSEYSTQFSLSGNLNRKIYDFAAKIGFRKLRVHTVDWERLEPERGQFKWEEMDRDMELARQYGFRDEDMVFNVFGTPRWASSNPEGNRLAMGTLRNYKTAIPADMKDWQNFLTRLMQRYPKVCTYELWNEPHFPGFSIFWSDTPENHVKLIKAGYEAVKKQNPAATVWWAGMSKRYTEFYRKFLSLGGGSCFDVLSIHGSWQNAAEFTAIEKECGVTPKPKVNSEWHANLLKPFQPFYPSEIQIARTTLLGFLHMLKQGINTVCYFTLFNDSGCELEELPVNRKYRRHDPCVAGLFRERPYTQPRYVAATWHHLTNLVRGNLKVHDSYEWKDGNGTCQAVHASSESGDLLFFWSLNNKNIPLPAALKEALRNARITAADGHPAATPAESFAIAPEFYYIAESPDLDVIKKWDNRANVLRPVAQERPLNADYMGVYRSAPLFDRDLNVIAPESLKMHSFRKEIACFKEAETGKISAEFAISFSDAGMDVLVRVKDPVFHPEKNAAEFWAGDSVQLALDTMGRGNPSDVVEIGISQDPDGQAHVRKTLSPMLDGDLPAQYTPLHANGMKLRYAKAAITRRDGITEYRAHIDATELYSFVYSKGCRPRFSILINNNNGRHRESFLEWGSGIGAVKDPALFGTLTAQLPDEPLLTSADLVRPSGDSGVHPVVTDGVARVESGSFRNAGVSTRLVPCTGGAHCVLSFEARGNGNLIVSLFGKGFKRLDPLEHWQPLNGDWQSFSTEVNLPESATALMCSAFYWEQKDKWFEIRNLVLKPAPLD